MGNVPISCCRSKSPRLHRNNGSNYRDGTEYSANNSDLSQGEKFSSKSSSKRISSNKVDEHQHQESSGAQSSQHILQHISEREPDDSETDPSSNPSNRPIFAARSSNYKGRANSNNYTDSYSSSNCTSIRKQNSTPLTSSQDHGYNSNTSTNLTQYDEQINDSFDSSFQQRQQAIGDNNQTISNNDKIILNKDNRLLLLNSPSNSDKTNQFSAGTRRFETSIDGLNHSSEGRLKKSSSCSTIFIDGSTISQPNLKQTIVCVSLAIYYHIKNRTSDNSAEIFDETIHPLKMPPPKTPDTQDELIILDREENSGGESWGEPDQKTIYSFVRTLFKSAQLTSEYAITTLVYLERLMTYAEMDLTPKTWRRMILGAIVLSSKVWEDQAVWNVDYAQILEEISVEDINELERQYLELIQFNMNVPSSVYAKYYFHLRTLALKNGLSKEQSLLTVGEAKTLEAMSRVHLPDWNGSSPIHRKSSPVIKRHTSLEKLRLNGLTKAVLM